MIFSQGDDANALFIVKKGIVDVIKDGNIVASVPEGSFFGENALLADSQAAKRSATISAKTEVICISLPRNVLIATFGQDVQAISLTNYARASLRKSEVLSQFTHTQHEFIMANMQIRSMEPDDVIFEKGREYNSILLIFEGSIAEEDEVEVCDTVWVCSGERVQRVRHQRAARPPGFCV